MKQILNKNIGTKLMLGFFVVILVIIIGAVATYLNLTASDEKFSFIIEHDLEVLSNIQLLQKYVVDAEAAQRGYIITGEEEFLESYISGNADFDELIVREKLLVSDNPAQVQILEKIQTMHDDWLENAGQKEIDARTMLQVKYDTGDHAALELIPRIILGGVIEDAVCGKCILDSMKVEFDTFIEIEKDLKYERFVDAKELSSNTIMIAFILAIVGTVVGSIIAVYLSRSIANPIKHAMTVADSISKGDLSMDIPISKSSDEIGQLNNSLREMSKNLIQVITDVRDAADQVSESSQNTSSSTEELNASVEQVSSTVNQISTGSQSQATELANTKAIVESVTDTGDDGDGSSAADKMAKIVQLTNESSVKINGLAEKSSKITSVVEVIREIAEKTNLLALNAAIEAARAGESGRGFAVVADEVRRLAEGSAKSSQEIDALLKDIQDEIQSTVTGIDQSAKEIEGGRIVVDKSLKALEDIGKKIQEISSVSEQNAASSEEAAASVESQTQAVAEISAATKHLDSLAELLKAKVGVFKLPQDVDKTKSNPSPKKQDAKKSMWKKKTSTTKNPATEIDNMIKSVSSEGTQS